MPGGIKMRSVSVEDLGNIVKHMINGVLENNDQVAKLRQAVFEEYYSKKMEELKKVKAKMTRRSESHDVPAEKFNETALLGSVHSEGTVSDSLKSEIVLNSDKAVKGETTSNVLIEELDPSTVHVIRRQKYVKLVEEADDDQAANVHHSNTALDLTNPKITMELTQTANHSVNSKVLAELEPDKKASDNVKMIEWWSSTSRTRVGEDNSSPGKAREIPVLFKTQGEIAFESWKKEKTNAYQRIFKEEQKRRRLEQSARDRQVEKKEAANEAYLYWRRQQDARQKLRNARNRILAQMESQKHQSMEKSRANSQAFKIWKRQKDAILRERRMYMMAYSGQSYPQQQIKPQKPRPGVDAAFNMWLDQLDCVLHQKYLRERRYLVRSFYCQPAYFGTAALCGR